MINENLVLFRDQSDLVGRKAGALCIASEGMTAVAGLTNLKRLRIRDTDVTGVGFAHIAGLTKLERLELRGTSLDDAGVDVISKLPNVTFLARMRNTVVMKLTPVPRVEPATSNTMST